MDYVTIRVSTLRGDQKINFNAFVKINDKMILYLRSGDSFEGDRLKRLKEKKLRKMFITTEDEHQYRSYLLNNIEVAYNDNSGKDLKTRSEIIQGMQQSNVDDVLENPQNEESYNIAKEDANKYVQFLLNNSGALNSIMDIQNQDQNLAHHGVSVATLAVGLAQKLKIDDKQTLGYLTMGGFLHDFGHMDSTINYNKPLKEMSTQELKIYHAHAKNGADKVAALKHFDRPIVTIINEHEECIDGSGPQKMREGQQDPMSVLISTANACDRLIAYEGVPKLEVAKTLMINQVGR
ncbi:MAG TPA: HD domain-containing protein, partial [Pseudobdellovibrionaceae bacterium]|nr:HD domain-containing protein [Pseudobdellovibrionaceae bacterium]